MAVDTDAHRPGQLEWHHYGLAKIAAASVAAGNVVNSWPAERLLEWTAGHTS